jgi:hypothetical protein
MGIQPAHESEEIVRPKAIHGLTIGFAGCGKIIFSGLFKKRANIQAADVLLRKQGFSALASIVPGDGIKVHDLGKTVVPGMELDCRRSL